MAAAGAVQLVAWTAAAATARGFSGTISYTGGRGPVNGQRPLCLCLFTDAQLTRGVGCLLFRRNNAGYRLPFDDRDYYLVAFLDVHMNQRIDPDDPYEIFLDRAAPPPPTATATASCRSTRSCAASPSRSAAAHSRPARPPTSTATAACASTNSSPRSPSPSTAPPARPPRPAL